MESYYDEYTARQTGKLLRVYKFDTISNPTDAYFVGLIAADGSYTYNEKKKFMRMGFSSNNVNLISAIRDRYCQGVEVIDRSNRIVQVNGRTYQNPNFELHFPVGIARSLANFGIACHKPQRVMARIPKQYMSAYLLGFIDGDGSIIVRHRKDCRYPRLNIHIVSGATKILTQIQRYLESDCNIASSIYERSEKYAELRINHTTRAIEFCNLIYSNLPNFYNIGKKEVFDTYCADYLR